MGCVDTKWRTRQWLVVMRKEGQTNVTCWTCFYGIHHVHHTALPLCQWASAAPDVQAATCCSGLLRTQYSSQLSSTATTSHLQNAARSTDENWHFDVTTQTRHFESQAANGAMQARQDSPCSFLSLIPLNIRMFFWCPFIIS